MQRVTSLKRSPSKTEITVLDYDGQHAHENQAETADECLGFTDEPTAMCVNPRLAHEIEILHR